MSVQKSDISTKLAHIRTVDEYRALAPNVAGHVRESVPAATVQHGFGAQDAKAFEEAGWKFVRAKTSSSVPAGNDVVVDVDGRLKILAHALNVKFRPTLSRSGVENILQRFSLSMRRDLGFSPNLFLVDDPGNAISTAKSLNKLDDVVFAEPVLIEAIGER